MKKTMKILLIVTVALLNSVGATAEMSVSFTQYGDDEPLMNITSEEAEGIDMSKMPSIIAKRGISETARTAFFTLISNEMPNVDLPVEIVLGNVNLDGAVDVEDVKLLQKAILGEQELSPQQAEEADVNTDGEINVFDICTLKQQILKNKESYPVENPVVIDEFTPCTATIDDDFDDWVIWIDIKHQYSVPERVWTIEDFNGIENIWKITQHESNINSQSPYRQSLEITLSDTSKENVLKLIHDIEVLNMVEVWKAYPVKHGLGGDIIDEFIPSTATIDDDFVDYMVEVTIKQQYTTDPVRVWMVEDFKDVSNIESVLEATYISSDRQILHILLNDCSKENVLKMIKDIEDLQLEEIMMVRTSSPLGLPDPVEGDG
ncbi:MAG TPA: dockerin type I repeat-containing protein [Sedimentibacter sp.]|nr:dockerin type I repeat-containing protein [Sedimentibacter sp.]